MSKFLAPGKPNALALEIFAPQKNDLGITWVDWNPTPADKDMGIWKEVFLTASDGVSLRNPFVTSKLDSEYKTAALTVSADLRNTSEHEVNGTLRAEIDGVQMRQPVKLAAGEAKTVTLCAGDVFGVEAGASAVVVAVPDGRAESVHAKLDFEIDGHVSDSADVTFGIREVTSELTDKGYRLVQDQRAQAVDSRRGVGAGHVPCDGRRERLDADLAYVRDMGLNTVRLEGRIDHEEFFDKADRLGILVMPGWTCCDAWETMEELERRAAQDRGRFAAEPDSNFAQSSERLCVAVWQRRAAAG